MALPALITQESTTAQSAMYPRRSLIASMNRETASRNCKVRSSGVQPRKITLKSRAEAPAQRDHGGSGHEEDQRDLRPAAESRNRQRAADQHEIVQDKSDRAAATAGLRDEDAHGGSRGGREDDGWPAPQGIVGRRCDLDISGRRERNVRRVRDGNVRLAARGAAAEIPEVVARGE